MFSDAKVVVHLVRFVDLFFVVYMSEAPVVML